MFCVAGNKTYYGKKFSMFGDFSLKIFGKLKLKEEENSAGHWVCCCGSASEDEETTIRLIVLNVNCFDSKQRFIDSLRAAYGEGTFLLGPHVTSAVVHSYACYLKEDFSQQENKRVFHETRFMGYQGNNYWIISNDVHIENGKVLDPIDHKYLILDKSLKNHQLQINESLLNDYAKLNRSVARFILLSQCLGPNMDSFLLATAFTVARLLRNALNPEDVWRESSIGMIFSEERSIGKSESLNLLARGVGIPNRLHVMLLSGGDSQTCGHLREFHVKIIRCGILLVWAIKYLELWAEVFEHAREIVEEVVQAIFDENDLKVQARWLSGIAAVLVANALLRLSCGNQANTKDYVLFACGELLKVQTVSIRSTMQRLEAYIIEKIAEEKDPILTWLHPKVTVNNIEGMKVPGIALLSTAVDSFVDISHTVSNTYSVGV
ncbi:uncharacterized protein LOC114544695 [Dendronephthya gigantea]|uniref:uncharacterized protein LOC114544695 n=1 Tax=Dendronephthya gigantea TaxID=151771 RepID=UPI00106AB68D|nr:uncharacterized protein LOC114544695 [Dendronephthya gigantea]